MSVSGPRYADLFDRAVRHAGAGTVPGVDMARASLAAALIPWWRGNVEEAVAWSDAALDASAGLHAPAERSRALAQRALVRSEPGGDVPALADDARLALEIATATGDQWLIGRASQACRHVEFARGQVDEAIGWSAKALAGYRRAGDAFRVASQLGNGPYLKYSVGDAAGSRRDLQEGLALAERIHARDERANILHHVALLDVSEGDEETAWRRAREALALAEQVGARGLTGDALLDLALVAGARGEHVLAATLHGAVAAQWRHDYPPGQLEAQLREDQLSRLRASLGDDGFERTCAEARALSARDAQALAIELMTVADQGA